MNFNVKIRESRISKDHESWSSIRKYLVVLGPSNRINKIVILLVGPNLFENKNISELQIGLYLPKYKKHTFVYIFKLIKIKDVVLCKSYKKKYFFFFWANMNQFEAWNYFLI